MDIQHRLELMRLLSALCDGELTDLEHARLEELLAQGADARQIYHQYIDLHVRLMVHPELAGSAGLAKVDRAELAADHSSGAAAVELPSRSSKRQNLRHLVPYAVIAGATLAAAILLQVWMWQPAGDPSLATTSKLPVTRTNYVATVAQSSDAEWEGEAEAFVTGARM